MTMVKHIYLVTVEIFSEDIMDPHDSGEYSDAVESILIGSGDDEGGSVSIDNDHDNLDFKPKSPPSSPYTIIRAGPPPEPPLGNNLIPSPIVNIPDSVEGDHKVIPPHLPHFTKKIYYEHIDGIADPLIPKGRWRC